MPKVSTRIIVLLFGEAYILFGYGLPHQEAPIPSSACRAIHATKN